MRFAKLFLVVSAISISAVALRSQLTNGQEPGGVKASSFMRLKLEPVKGALEGIASGGLRNDQQACWHDSQPAARRKLDGGSVGGVSSAE